MNPEMTANMDTNRAAALELRVKALEADAEVLRKRTVELSGLVARMSGTLRQVAEQGLLLAQQHERLLRLIAGEDAGPLRDRH